MMLLTSLLVIILGFTHAAIGAPTAKGSPGKCKKARSLKIFQVYEGPFIEPNGTLVDFPDTTAGLRLPYAGSIYDAPVPDGKVVAFNWELCTRLNDTPDWYCEGMFKDLYGCKGSLNYAGSFTDGTFKGDYTITGGTKDFDGVKGYITEDLGAMGAANRTIFLHY